jgi:hypothetical protein
MEIQFAAEPGEEPGQLDLDGVWQGALQARMQPIEAR